MAITKEVVMSIAKEQKQRREQVIERSRVTRECKVNRLRIAETLKNTLNDAAYNYGLVDSKITALDLERYYRDNIDQKDRDGFITIMSYEEQDYLRAMKTMVNALKSKTLLVRVYTNEFNTYHWNVEPCENFKGMKFADGVIHVKRQITETTHHDYLILFGKNNRGQRYISYRIIKRVPNTKVYEA